MKKILFSLIFFCIIINFVSGVTYPAPFTSGFTNGEVSATQPPQEENARAIDENQCIKNHGCWDNLGCHSIGYRKDNLYCYDKFKFITLNTYKSGFVNQTKTGKFCANNYECQTNLCLNGKCADLSEEINNKVNTKLTELKQETLNQAEELTNSTEESNLGIQTESEPFLDKILNWFKRFF